MDSSLVKYRLQSNVFVRMEENNPEKPKRVVFLSVEGAVTEVQYFKHLGEHIIKNNDTVLHVEVLQRKRNDGHSSPEHVIELLNEYMEVRDKELPELWMKRLKNDYSQEVIAQLITKDLDADLSKTEHEICDALLIAGIDLQYRKFLKGISSTDDRDIVAAIIDRDGGEGGRSRKIIESCITESSHKGYRLFLTNPCFEFWLLLHLCDVEVEYADKQADLLKNETVSNQHTYVSREVSNRAGHAKNINKKKFCDYYLPNILRAIEGAKTFATELLDILDNVGTNLPDLLHELGY